MEKFEAALRRVRERTPLVQCITNFVTVNDCANICLLYTSRSRADASCMG